MDCLHGGAGERVSNDRCRHRRGAGRRCREDLIGRSAGRASPPLPGSGGPWPATRASADSAPTPTGYQDPRCHRFGRCRRPVAASAAGRQSPPAATPAASRSKAKTTVAGSAPKPARPPRWRRGQRLQRPSASCHILLASGCITLIRRQGLRPRCGTLRRLERYVARPRRSRRRPALVGPVRVGDAAAGVEHVLEQRLHLQPRRELRLIGEFEDHLARADRGEPGASAAMAASPARAVSLMRAQATPSPAVSFSRPNTPL